MAKITPSFAFLIVCTKCTALEQPWASLIVDGYKKYEFRSWKTKYRGKILIHAGMSLEKDMVKKFETATLTLQQKQGRFNRNPEEVFNVVAMLQRHGLNLGGNEN